MLWPFHQFLIPQKPDVGSPPCYSSEPKQVDELKLQKLPALVISSAYIGGQMILISICWCPLLCSVHSLWYCLPCYPTAFIQSNCFLPQMKDVV